MNPLRALFDQIKAALSFGPSDDDFEFVDEDPVVPPKRSRAKPAARPAPQSEARVSRITMNQVREQLTVPERTVSPKDAEHARAVQNGHIRLKQNIAKIEQNLLLIERELHQRSDKIKALDAKLKEKRVTKATHARQLKQLKFEVMGFMRMRSELENKCGQQRSLAMGMLQQQITDEIAVTNAVVVEAARASTQQRRLLHARLNLSEGAIDEAISEQQEDLETINRVSHQLDQMAISSITGGGLSGAELEIEDDALLEEFNSMFMDEEEEEPVAETKVEEKATEQETRVGRETVPEEKSETVRVSRIPVVHPIAETPMETPVETADAPRVIESGQ